MTDVLTKKQRSYNMSRIRGQNTLPELIVRKILSSNNIRGYRLDSIICGKPDIVFTKYKIAIFIDGCFWHKCPICFKMPKQNKKFWSTKINRNAERDNEVNKQLKREGWTVIRLWEHLLIKNTGICYKRIVRTLIQRGYLGKNT